MSKITDVLVDVLEVELPAPIRARLIEIRNTYIVLVRVRSTDGLEGIGYGAVLQRPYAAPLASLIDGISPAIVGLGTDEPERGRLRLEAASFKAGPGGMATWAVSAIEIALWDLFARSLERPLHAVLGSVHTTLPTYSILGLSHREFPELIDQVREAVDDGMTAVKIFVGGLLGPHGIADVPRRLTAIREAIPDNVRLAIDNQDRFRPHEAIRLGHSLAEFDLFWFEEPVDHRDLSGLADVAAALDVPVCSGEQLFGLQSFRDLIKVQAADVVMVDIRMSGGVSNFKKIAGLAEAHNLPIVNHMMTAIDVQVMASAPNAGPAEYVPWTDAIFEEPIQVSDGALVVPDGPGAGVRLVPGIVEKCRI